MPPPCAFASSFAGTRDNAAGKSSSTAPKPHVRSHSQQELHMSTVRRSLRSQSGFSLAEVFVATAIFAVIFIAALLVYDRSNKIFKAGVEAADLQQNTRVAFDKLMADTRLAGFDFDRDGVPTAAGQAQQPDEQIEYARSEERRVGKEW